MRWTVGGTRAYKRSLRPPMRRRASRAREAEGQQPRAEVGPGATLTSMESRRMAARRRRRRWRCSQGRSRRRRGRWRGAYPKSRAWTGRTRLQLQRRHHPVHRRPGQGRQTHSKQVVLRHAIRGRLQAGFGAPRSVHQAEGRHQRLCCPVPPAVTAAAGPPRNRPPRAEIDRRAGEATATFLRLYANVGTNQRSGTGPSKSTSDMSA
jgi:hypothetical protein